MADAPKGVDVPTEMSGGKADVAGQKFVRIDPAYAKAETTALKADVKSGANTFDFDVK